MLIVSADYLERFEAAFERAGRQRDGDGSKHHDGRMTEREEQTDANRPLALLHLGPRDIVDCRDVVGVDGVTQPERIGEKGGADQHRIIMEGDQRPDPRQHIGENQNDVDADDPATEFRILIVEQSDWRGPHEMTLRRWGRKENWMVPAAYRYVGAGSRASNS